MLNTHKLNTCFSSIKNINLTDLKRNNSISTDLQMDKLTILKSSQVKDGIIFITKQNPEIKINIGSRPSHRLRMSHLKLTFSNITTLDGDV